MREEKKLKVCFAASSGGHLEQLMMLKPLMKKYDSFILTEKTQYQFSVSDTPVHYVRQVNRKEKFFLFHLVINLFQSLRLYCKEKPDVIICTGVLATIPMCLTAKMFRKKVVYIESFAKVTTPTSTGKLLYKFADRFYVQWESMKEIYPNAMCLGGIY